MAKIERKAHYVGTWREDIVTDTFMRQIIARSMAEKGQKVKVKLSKDGLIISKTVLMQESYLSTFSLQDVYFLTVNQRHPTCLLCIVADPVRKYLILALRTANEVEAQELISTFKSLKDNPAINAGNVVLRRKDNGNWTLRERSQQNADRHLKEVFQDTTTTTIITPHLSHPNGSASQEYSPVLDAKKVTNHNGRHVYKLVPDSRDEGDGGGGEVVSITKEVDDLSQELRDVKFVVEKSGSVSSATLKNNLANNNNNTEKSHYIVTDPTTKRAEPVLNGGVVRAHSNVNSNDDDRAGEVRIAVNDHRQDGIVRAQSNGSANPAGLTTLNGGFRQRITVPEPKGPITITATTTRTTPQNPDSAANGYSDVPAYQIKRRVSTEYVTVPDFSRKMSQGGSVRSLNRVSFDPEATQFSKDRHAQFRSVRMSRSSAVPTTIIRPIEEIYGHGHATPRHAYVKRHSGVYIPSSAPVLVAQQQPQPGNTVYVSHPVATLQRRSRPNSIHVMDGNELKVFHKTGDLDDLLL